jgi:RHS repeat-associated protein
MSLTDLDGDQAAVYAYDPWGVPEKGGHRSTATNRFRFTGEEFDDSMDLYYLRARWYDPSVGRFLTKDPIPRFLDHSSSLTLYVYARNNPLRFLDPTGQTAIEGATPHDRDFINLGGLSVPQEKLKDPQFFNRLQADISPENRVILPSRTISEKERRQIRQTEMEIAKIQSNTQKEIDELYAKAEELTKEKMFWNLVLLPLELPTPVTVLLLGKDYFDVYSELTE